MSAVSVRYIVEDVDAAVSFYREQLGFRVEMYPAPGFAMLSRGNLRLLLNAPGAGGAGQPTSEGHSPRPGGWNRIQIDVEDLASAMPISRARGRASGTTSHKDKAVSRFFCKIRQGI